MPQTVSLEIFAPSARVRRTMKTCAAKGKSIPQAVTGAVMIRREVVRPLAFSRVRWAEGKSAPQEALFDPLAQLLLVVLYGEQIVCPFVLNDVPGTFSLGVESVSSDDGSVEFQRGEQIRQGGDFIALVVDGYLVLNHRFVVRECREEVEFVVVGFVWAGATYDFSINGDGVGAVAL